MSEHLPEDIKRHIELESKENLTHEEFMELQYGKNWDNPIKQLWEDIPAIIGALAFIGGMLVML